MKQFTEPNTGITPSEIHTMMTNENNQPWKVMKVKWDSQHAEKLDDSTSLLPGKFIEVQIRIGWW